VRINFFYFFIGIFLKKWRIYSITIAGLNGSAAAAFA
jgi:hypothetical protein